MRVRDFFIVFVFENYIIIIRNGGVSGSSRNSISSRVFLNFSVVVNYSEIVWLLDRLERSIRRVVIR